jgi:hypothetical protein
MTESFFFNGMKLKNDFSLNQLDYIVFSDGTHVEFMHYEQGIRFTKDMLFLCQNSSWIKGATESDDWQDWEIIEICPWENIISIDRHKGANIIRSIPNNEINYWLNNLEEIPLSFPILSIKNRTIAIIMNGRPYSERSERGLIRQKDIYQTLLSQITSIVKKPVNLPTYLFIDVFTTQREKLADADRFVKPIMDFFKGILYEDDSQVTGLYPRILSMKKQFTVLECRTEPMGLDYIENIPIGSLFPLAKNIRDYYVIRFKI